MGAVRALQRRVARLERADKPRPSPFVMWFGSFDAWVERHVLPDIENGLLDCADIVVVIAALRTWESDATWDRAHAS